MGLKIKSLVFLYDGTTRLFSDEEGKVTEHRDYFYFCSGTFGNIPDIGAFLDGYTQDLLTKIMMIY